MQFAARCSRDKALEARERERKGSVATSPLHMGISAAGSSLVLETVARETPKSLFDLSWSIASEAKHRIELSSRAHSIVVAFVLRHFCVQVSEL